MAIKNDLDSLKLSNLRKYRFHRDTKVYNNDLKKKCYFFLQFVHFLPRFFRRDYRQPYLFF